MFKRSKNIRVIEHTVEVTLGKAMVIEAGKTYVIRASGSDLYGDQIETVLKTLREQTDAKWIYISGALEILRES